MMKMKISAILPLTIAILMTNLNFCATDNENFSWNFNDSESSNFADDKHATSANEHRIKRNSNSFFLPSSSNGNSFRAKVYRNFDNDGRETGEYVTMDPSFFNRMKSSEAHGGLRYKVTRVVHLPKQGRITGIVRELPSSSRLARVDQYLGIPYAEAPVGSRRFMPPSNPLPWSGIREANKMESVCPQKLPDLSDPSGYSRGRYEQIKRLLPHLKRENEDCLYLNLYVESYDENNPSSFLPVIVFLHGESFEWNSGNSYDGSILASYGCVIVITLNYRLGALGFLKPGLNDQTVANFGLLDIIAALQWIKENIEQFGGDKNSVTLLGYDTGAICANFLMISPVAQGLFHRAILISGSALSDWALNYNPQQITMEVAKQLNCPIEDSKLGECLRMKSYREIVDVNVSVPEFLTIFGPIVDGLVISDPKTAMSSSETFGQYDLLFGMTEIEAYNILRRDAIVSGIPQADRDHNIRRYLINRYDKRPEIAILSTLKEYTNGFVNQKPSSQLEHRDMLFDILSDARVIAPMVQSGIYLSRSNTRCYMYVFNHNSEAGDHAGNAKSIHGEDLPYIFGAPMGGISPSPFQTTYNEEEQWLSKAVMKYFTHFARTGSPTEIQRSLFPSRTRHREPNEWDKYDIDWQEFNEINQNYLLLGIPPVPSSRFRHQFVKFWNEGIVETMKNVNSAHNQNPGLYGKAVLGPSSPSAARRPAFPSTGQISMYPIKVEIEGAHSEDPIRELRYRLQQPRDSHLNPAPTSASLNVIVTTEPVIHEAIPSGDEEIFKSETTAFLLIAVIVTFLLVNIIGLGIYMYRRGKKLNRKYDNSNLYDTNDDRRSKYNDTDESFILRKSNNTYESVKRHSPINGFGIRRQISSSTVDTHTKVMGWMSSDVDAKKPLPKNSSFSTLKREKVSVAVDATPQARSNSILRQEPIEVTKAKSSFEYGNRIVCQDVDMDMSMIDEIPFHHREFREMTESGSSECSSCSHCEECAMNRQLTYGLGSDRGFDQHDEKVTSFIEPRTIDVNVTSRDDREFCEKIPMSPEETIKLIQRMNCPKVLPSYPENHQFTDSRRRSLQIPSQYYQIHQNPPEQSARETSTLGRKSILRSEPIRVEEPPPKLIPETTSSSITFGPLIPKSENIYMSMQRRKSLNRQNSTCVVVEPPTPPTPQQQQQPHARNNNDRNTQQSQTENLENPPPSPSALNENLYAEIIKNSRVQQPQDGIYSITTGVGAIPSTGEIAVESKNEISSSSSATSSNNKKLKAANSLESNSSASSSSEQSSTGTVKEMN